MAITKDIIVNIQVDGNPAPIFPETGILAVRENMDYFLPTTSIEFDDSLSTFVSIYPFLQDTKIQVSLDDTEINKRLNFFAFSDVATQVPESVQEMYHCKLDMISCYSDPLLLTGEFHSDRLKASDYIKYLADRLGLGFDVEDTRDVRTWINPNWRYAQMVRYLAQRSLSVQGSSGYMYFVRDNGDGTGTLVFKTIDGFFEDSNQDEDLIVYLSNEDIGRDVSIRRNNFGNVVMGGNTSKVSFMNYNTGQFATHDLAYNDPIKKRALKQGVSQTFYDVGRRRYYRGVYAQYEDLPSMLYYQSYKQALLSAEAVQLRVTTTTNLERRLGDVINLTLSTREDVNQQSGINLNYSGRYLLKGIVTKYNGVGYQTLYLVRPGLNLQDNRIGYY